MSDPTRSTPAILRDMERHAEARETAGASILASWRNTVSRPRRRLPYPEPRTRRRFDGPTRQDARRAWAALFSHALVSHYAGECSALEMAERVYAIAFDARCIRDPKKRRAFIVAAAKAGTHA